MKPPPEPNPELLRLLEMASAQLRCFPDEIIMSSAFDTSHEVAEFIDQSASRLRAGDSKAGRDLLMLFLPTGDWDDAGGSQDIANRLCELLDPYFTPGRSENEGR